MCTCTKDSVRSEHTGLLWAAWRQGAVSALSELSSYYIARYVIEQAHAVMLRICYEIFRARNAKNL
jgi:hypothetical protein